MAASTPIWLIGLDGASFDILQPMFDAGKLPVLAGLMRDGASGILKSSMAPFTPQAWATVMTGLNPGRHGVFGFVREMPGVPPEFLSLNSMKGERIWTRLGRSGRQSLIMNVPLTYPPEPLSGRLISGMMTPSVNNDFTYPLPLKDRVLSKHPNYRLDVRGGIEFSRDLSLLDELDAAVTARAEAARDLILEEMPDFLFLVFILPDRIQHTYCRFIHPQSAFYDSARARRWRARIWDSYTRLDRVLGELLSLAPAETNVAFISDHGFTIERGSFSTNDFLAEVGALALKPGSARNLAKSLIRKFNVVSIKQFVPGRLVKKTIGFTKEAIDWSKTAAYASSPQQQGIFINTRARGAHGTVDNRDYEPWRDKIIAALAEIKHPVSGAPVVIGHRREELFSGLFLESIPDIILEFTEAGWEAKDTVLGGDPVSSFKAGTRGLHDRDGIFIAAGPAVNRGRYEGLTLEDVMPNLLAIAGVEAPAGLDGQVRPDVFNIPKERP